MSGKENLLYLIRPGPNDFDLEMKSTETKVETGDEPFKTNILYRLKQIICMYLILCDVDNTILWNFRRKWFCARKAGAEISMRAAKENYSIRKFLNTKQKRIFDRIFFSNRYLHMDIPRKDASKTIQMLSKKYRIVYFTARHEGMRKGTSQWLKTHGFPYPDNKKVFLFMKPRMNPEISDDIAYKKKTISEIKKLGKPFVAIDDIPEELEFFKKAGFKTILIKTPYNRAGIKNWLEIRRELCIQKQKPASE